MSVNPDDGWDGCPRCERGSCPGTCGPTGADEFAAQFAYDLHLHAISGARANQTIEGRIGASDFTCRERMRRIMSRQQPTDSPSKWAAFVGTAVHDRIAAARAAANPGLLFEQRLPVTLPSGFQLHVTPDEIDPSEPSVTDYKTKNTLAHVRRTPSDDPHRIQRHLQYLACLQNGIISDAGGVVRNVYVDRSGADDQPHVEQEPFSPQIVALADQFIADVTYAIEHGEEAWKDQPRQWCQRFCEHFTACRGWDADDAAAAILDPRVEEDARALLAAKAEAADAEQRCNTLRDRLLGLTGTTRGGIRVRTTLVNPKDRAPYRKLEVSA